MGKVLKIVAVVAAIAAAIPSGGTSLLAAGLGVSATVASAIAVGLTVGASLLNKPKAPQNSPANSDRLRASIDPRAFRKSATGYTALNTDIRDEEFSDDQAYLHRFIVVAAHKVQSMDEIWFDDELAWSATGGVASKFAGYLALDVCTEGSAAEAVNISSRMGSSRRYTGCAYVYLRYKLTGNDKKAESPFAQSVPTRITIRGKGAFFYDPRKDSTVPGGSGSHRADNQATWEWSDSACHNPALALLWNLLGWRINGELSVGRGIPKERIDLESFAVAANLCDENVAKAGGGTEPRYRCDGVWSEGDSPTTVTDMLKASMNADLDDVDGKLRVTIFRDDTFVSDADFTTDDVLGAFDWEPITPLDQSFNIVRGAYTDASNQSLYQQIDYPQQRATSPDGIDRIDTFNVPMVQSVSQAQRLAALRLNREKFSGTFRAEFQATAWRVQKNSIVRLTFAPLGFVNKTFRVVEMDLREDGVVPLLLREEDSSIYVTPALQFGPIAVNSTPYNPVLSPIVQGIAESGGAPPGTLVGNREAQQVVDDIDFNADAILEQILRGDSFQALLAARTLINGTGVNTVIAEFKSQQTATNEATANKFDLLGASINGGTAFQLNASSVYVDPTTSLSTKLTTIENTLGTQTASIETLNEVLIDPSGATVRSVLKLDVNGNISGMIATNNGQTSSVAFLTNSFKIVDPNGGAPYTPFSVAGGVIKMTNVEVDTIKIGSGGTSSKPSIVSSSTAISGSGAYVEALGTTVVMDGPGTIYVSVSAGQSFPNGDKTWNCQITVDGQVLAVRGGTITADSVSIQAALYIAEAGIRTIKFNWNGQSGCSIASRNMFAIAYYGS